MLGQGCRNIFGLRNDGSEAPDSGPPAYQSGPLPFVALFLILSGFVLVVFGLFSGGGAAGCFVWPFPLVVACGLGLGGGVEPLLVLAAFAGIAALVFWLTVARSRETA